MITPKDLQIYSQKYKNPPSFKVGDIVTPWQKYSDMETGQLCIVTENHNKHLMTVLTINKTLVELKTVQCWLFMRVA